MTFTIIRMDGQNYGHVVSHRSTYQAASDALDKILARYPDPAAALSMFRIREMEKKPPGARVRVSDASRMREHHADRDLDDDAEEQDAIDERERNAGDTGPNPWEKYSRANRRYASAEEAHPALTVRWIAESKSLARKVANSYGVDAGGLHQWAQAVADAQRD